MAFYDDIKNARDTAAGKLAAAMAAAGPNYSVDGQSVDRMAYIKTLLELITELENIAQWANGPVIFTTRGKC